MEEEAGVMDVVDAFMTLLGAGDTIASIFGSDGLSLEDLFTRLVSEIRDIFQQELENEDVRNATAVAQDTSDWFSNIYASNQASGYSPDQLYASLKDGVITALIEEVGTWCSTMEQWSSASANDLSQQTASLALLLHGWIVAYYRELRSTTAFPDEKASAELTLQKYAIQAVQRVLPLYSSVATARMSAVAPIATVTENGIIRSGYFRDSWLGDAGPPQYAYDDVLNGYYPTESASTVVLVETDSDDAQAAVLAQVQAIHASYVRLLQYGENSDRDSLIDAINGSPGQGTLTRNAPDLIATTVPKILETGRWLSQATNTLRTLWEIAGGKSGYVVAYQGSDGGLTTNGDDGARSWELGMSTGTSATVTGTPLGYQMAFNSNQRQLWNAGISGNGSQPVFLAAGSTPSIVCMPDTSIRVFVSLADGFLGEWDLDAHTPVRQIMAFVAPGTSPSAALMPGGDVIVAFHGINGTLWIVQEDGNASDTSWPMAPGTSPSVAVLTDGSWIVAFQWATGMLCTLAQTTTLLWNSIEAREMLPRPTIMAPGSSPAIASSSVNDFMIVYQAADLSIHTIGSAGTAAWGQGMAGSNPAVAALPFQGYQIAYQDSTGALQTAGDGIPLTGSLPMLAGISSPRIAGLQVTLTG